MKFLSIFKKKINNNQDLSNNSFDLLMNITENHIADKSKDEQILILNYLIDSLKIDICSSGIILPLIKQPVYPLQPPFPSAIKDKSNNLIEITHETIEVRLSDTDIYTTLE